MHILSLGLGWNSLLEDGLDQRKVAQHMLENLLGDVFVCIVGAFNTNASIMQRRNAFQDAFAAQCCPWGFTRNVRCLVLVWCFLGLVLAIPRYCI